MKGFYFDAGWMYKPLCIITEDISKAMEKASKTFSETNLNPVPVICSKIYLPYYGEFFWHLEKADDFAIRLTDEEIDIFYV